MTATSAGWRVEVDGSIYRTLDSDRVMNLGNNDTKEGHSEDEIDSGPYICHSVSVKGRGGTRTAPQGVVAISKSIGISLFCGDRTRT